MDHTRTGIDDALWCLEAVRVEEKTDGLFLIIETPRGSTLIRIEPNQRIGTAAALEWDTRRRDALIALRGGSTEWTPTPAGEEPEKDETPIS